MKANDRTPTSAVTTASTTSEHDRCDNLVFVVETWGGDYPPFEAGCSLSLEASLLPDFGTTNVVNLRNTNKLHLALL